MAEHGTDEGEDTACESNLSIPPKGDKRRVRQAAKRASYTREDLYTVLDSSNIGHVAFVHEGWPQSIPTAIARIDDALYLHGSRSSRLYQLMASGARICVSVCRVNALVKARSAFHCSMNYYSAVVFGCGQPVDPAAKPELLDRFTEHLIPGTSEDFRPYLEKELKATELIRLPLDEFSVKIRTGDPVDDEEDLNLPHWAGIIPVESSYGALLNSANLPEGISPPNAMLSALGIFE